MLKNIYLSLATTTAIAFTSGVVASSTLEPTACKSENLHCFYSERGVVISTSPKKGNELIVMESAAQRYERHFGSRPKPGVVISGEAVNSVDVTHLIRQDGFQAVVPWLSNADRLRLAEYHIRTQIREQMPDISDERLEKSVQASLAAMNDQSEAGSQETEDGALAHELSHMWFISEFWPEDFAPGNTPASYGGPAPDWLDEMAAVLAENEQLTQRRWKHFAELDLSDTENAFYPLAEFFTMEHPMAEAVRTEDEQDNGTDEDQIDIQVRVMTQDDVANMEGRDPTIFYTQSRAFADYMIETSKNERIFADITRHIVGGGVMENWLQKFGKKNGLPQSVAGLELDWRAWLTARQNINDT